MSTTNGTLIAQYFEIREVGKTIKSTKKQYIWRFKLEGKDYTVEMFTSVLSGKKKILQNGNTIFYDSKYNQAFLFPWTIGRNALSIVQHGDKFELRINNQSFTHLWDNERTKKNFSYDGGNQQSMQSYQSSKNNEASSRSTLESRGGNRGAGSKSQGPNRGVGASSYNHKEERGGKDSSSDEYEGSRP